MTDTDRLEAIIREVQTRQVTMYPGREPRADELLVAEIERLRSEVAFLRREMQRQGVQFADRYAGDRGKA